MHCISGELRKIISTNGKALLVILSPDGSRIAYSVYDNFTRGSNQYIIPTLEDLPVSLGPGYIGQFRPDGKRLGYIRGNGHDRLPSGWMEFWSVAVDGSAPRREFIDSLSGSEGAASFSYSPDGKKVAWIRTFPERFHEIVVHNLETGEEHIVTADKKHIGTVAWLHDDILAYTTDKSGLFNVWVTSVSSGNSEQITHETTIPPTDIKATAYGNKLLFLQSIFMSDLFLVDIVNDRSKQITFTEDFKMYPSFSPDGRRIAFTFSDDNLVSRHIYIMDRDGQNRKQLSPEDEYPSNVQWSPNSRWISYSSRKNSEPEDSARTYLLDMINPGPPRYIANGWAYNWIDSTRFQIINNDEVVHVTSIDRAPLTQVYDDSTFAHYTVGGKYIIYRDRREGKDPKQWWIVDGTAPRDVQRKTARKLIKPQGWIKFAGNTVYWSTGIGEVWRMTIPDGQPDRIKANLLGVDNQEYFGASWDGKEVIIGKWRNLSKMVLIENLFK